MSWPVQVLSAVDTICSTLIKIKQFEYSSPFSNGALQAAEQIVLHNAPHTDRAVVEAANEYLVHAFAQARKLDLKKAVEATLPDYRR
jgi:1-deoxy-D-xylulose 5-phosphate reductoisomerase